MGLGLDGVLLGAPLLGEAVQQHTGDGHEGPEGGERGELGLEHHDGGGDQEDALEGVAHGVGDGVYDAQAPEGNLVCGGNEKELGGEGGGGQQTLTR